MNHTSDYGYSISGQLPVSDGGKETRHMTSLSHFYCPACGSAHIVDIDVQWSAQSLEPTDRGNEGVLNEYQCADCSLSIWIGADTPTTLPD